MLSKIYMVDAPRQHRRRNQSLLRLGMMGSVVGYCAWRDSAGGVCRHG